MTIPIVGSWSAPCDHLTTSFVVVFWPGRSVRPGHCRFRGEVFGGSSCHTDGVMDTAVMDALVQSQRLGFLGDRPIDEVVTHARAFVSALDGVTGRVVDLGSGGGVPGLVIAHDRPDLELLLVDRRAKRTDFLDRVVRRLGWADRVSVVCADVEVLMAAGDPGIDAAVARGFGPPMWTLEVGTTLVRPGGITVISEPPDGDRWSPERVAELGVSRLDDGSGAVSVFQKHAT